jgi:hypothetical protein
LRESLKTPLAYELLAEICLYIRNKSLLMPLNGLARGIVNSDTPRWVNRGFPHAMEKRQTQRQRGGCT